MRAFLILLLLANLGYLAWRQGWVFERAEPSVERDRSAFQPAGQSLVLLSELPQERRDLMSSLAAAQAARSESQQQLQQLEREATTVEGEIDEVEGQLQQDLTRSAETQQALLDTLDAAVESVEQEPPANAPVPWCAEAGVFADRDAAASFVQSLADFEVEAVIENRQEPVSSTWWVYMPAFPSEALAMEMLAELQAKNIDSYFMRNGDMAGGISLGVFSRWESALIEQQRKADQGYQTSLREVFRMGDRVYVELAMPDGAQRETPEWAAFLASASGVEVVEIACEMIASENEFP